MTTVNDIADILRIVREQPEWADALRGALLSQELLELPQRFAEFVITADKRFAALESDVAELKSDVAELKSDVAGLKDDVRGIKEDIVDIKGELRKHTGDIGNLRGRDYERKVGDNIRSIVSQHLNLRKVRVLKGHRGFDEMSFFDLIDDAHDRGIIDRQQRIDVGNIDIVLQGQDHPEGAVVYAALEISVEVADGDIARASARADILRQVMGEQSLPVVIGANIDRSRREFAAQQGVTLIAIAD